MDKGKRTNKVILVTLTILMALTTNAKTQESNLRNWLIYIGNKKLNSKWNIHNEIQYRNYNGIGDLEQLLLRTGLGYNLNETNNVLLGYGYILSENYIGDTDDKISVNEHRIFQQYTAKQNVGKVNLNKRYNPL